MRLKIFICLLLAGVTLAIYWPARHYDLIYFDDPLFVTETPEINNGVNWHNLAWAFRGVMAANWHPVTSLTFLFTHQFGGANPGIEHLVNALLHVANAVLLFLVLARLVETGNASARGNLECGDTPPLSTARFRPGGTLNQSADMSAHSQSAIWCCAAVSALFAWHPLRVESVAWIAERKDVLCAFFFLLTLLCYARYVEEFKVRSSKSKVFFGLSVLAFALGLMSKAMVVTLPFVLLLLDFWPLRRLARFDKSHLTPALSPASGGEGGRHPTLGQLLWEKWPFFALTAIFCVVTYWIQQTGAAMSSLDRTGLDARLANIVMSYWRYLGKAVWPTELAMLYPFPVNERSYLALWPWWQIIAAAAALLLVSVLCARQLARRPYLAVGWFWYLGMMLPVIGLVQVGGQGMADRYTYLPIIGPAVAVVWFVAGEFNSGWRRKILIGVTVCLLAALAWQTRQQLKYWRDTVTLFNRTVEVTGDNALGQSILADGYEHQGRVTEAIVHTRVAIAINPGDRDNYQQLARLLIKKQEWGAAAAVCDTLLAFNPNDVASQLERAEILPHLGRQHEAIRQLEAALQLHPDSTEALNNLAWMLATCPEADLRDGARAVRLAERACELTPYKKTVYVGTLAAAYAEAGRFDEAVATAGKAIALAEKNHEPELEQKNRELLELYRAHEPYRE